MQFSIEGMQHNIRNHRGRALVFQVLFSVRSCASRGNNAAPVCLHVFRARFSVLF